MHWQWLPLCLLSVGLATAAFAQSAAVKDHNLQFTDKAGKTTALTADGRVTEASLAPDGQWVVFVRQVDGKEVSTGAGDIEPTELWQVRVDGQAATLLLRCHEATSDEEHGIGGFEDLQFSADGKLVYFISPEWATSGAVHVLDTTTGQERFVCPGNDLKLVKSGDYKDCLLVQQHRYFVAGGSYDWYWLLRPDGTEVGAVGEDTSDFEALYESD